MVIREAREEDLDQFIDLGGALHLKHCREQFARGSEVTILVAEDAGKIVGKVHIDWAMKASEHIAYLESAATREDRRQEGIASKLFDAAEQLARDRGCVAVELVVEDFNVPAVAMYEKRGYKSGEITVCSYDVERDSGKIERVNNAGHWLHKDL